MKRVIFVTMACLFLHGPAWADADLSTLLKGVRETYGGLKGLSIQYRREVITRTMSMLGKKASGDIAFGQMVFRPPHFLRLDQESPNRETLITDGTSLWWYVPDKQKAYRYDAKEFGRELKLLSDIFRGLARVEDNFQVILHDMEGQTDHRIELIPDPPWQQVDRIQLTVTPDHHIAEVRIYNLMGGVTVFELRELEEKKTFPKGFFSLKLPDGVELIDERPHQ